MIRIPAHIDQIVSYKAGKPIQEIRREYQIEKIAKLGSNENTAGPSPKAITGVKEMLDSAKWYPEPASLDLKDKIAKFLNKKREEIVLGVGSEAVLSYIYRAFLEQGEEVISCNGTFIGIYVLADVYRVKMNKLPLTANYGFDLDKIIDSIGPNTRMIYLANPNNPTGTMISTSELEQFMQRVPDDVLVILDEAYYEYATALSLDYPHGTDYNYENMIVLHTFSKAYGMAGFRIGYGVSNPRLVQAMTKVKLTFEPTFTAQIAAYHALDDAEFIMKTVQNNKAGINYFYQEFDKLGLNYIKSYANFVTIDFGSEETVTQLTIELLKNGVIVRPLAAFGLPHCIRITVGQPQENEMCVTELQKLLS
ncbi:MAG: histidinol-phosphate transaminase [Calditrichaeota bacterium]|nr:histidinol-phosphate transaminase [Calditrichota bacterium]